MLTRRSFAFLLPAAALGVWPRSAGAQGGNASGALSFPTALVRIIVPFPPGGGTDVLARLLSSNLQNLWGQSVILENRPGAAGLIGARAVAAAAPDGHTLLMASTGAILALASAPADGTPASAAGRDIARELAPISLVAAPPYILVR